MVKVRNWVRFGKGTNLHGIVVLLASFLFGVTSLIVIKMFADLGAFTNALAVLVTGIALMAYAAVSYFSNQTKIEPETIGDNCYYLGFLFTLTSLSIALFQISRLGDDVLAYRQLISGFGVALSSTIIGVFLRVMLMQGRHDLSAREREARLSLNQATSELRGVLAHSIAEMKNFSVETTQLLSETAVSISRVAEEARDNQRSAISAETAKSLASIEGKLTAVNELITRQMSDVLSSVAQNVGAEVHSFAQRSMLESKEMAADIRVEISKTNEQIAGLVSALSASATSLTRSIETVVRAVDAFKETTASSAGNFAQELSTTIKGLGEKSKEIHDTLKQVQSLSRELERERASWMATLWLRVRTH